MSKAAKHKCQEPEKKSPILPKTGPADDLPSFRETFKTPEDLDDRGCNALLNAILLRTAQDYYEVCDQQHTVLTGDEDVTIPALCTRTMIEAFINGAGDLEFDSITSITPRTFKEAIKAIKRRGDKLPTISYGFTQASIRNFKNGNGHHGGKGSKKAVKIA